MKIRFVLIWITLAVSVFPVHADQQSQNSQAQSSQGTTQQPIAAASIDPAKQADIQRLIELTGGKAAASQAMKTMEQTIKPALINSLPPGDYRTRLVDLFFERLDSKIQDKLTELVVPAYDKYYSDDDIKGLIQFYETPLGQKMAAVTPMVMSEVQANGQKLGQAAGRQAMLEILAEHPELAEALASAQKAMQAH
jgi:hypothetical protein